MEGDQLPSGNNNLLLSETIKLIEQMKVGDISVIECGIEIGYRERMHHSQAGFCRWKNIFFVLSNPRINPTPDRKKS